MMSPYLAKLKQMSHRRKMHNLSLSLGQHLSQLERLDRELALARHQQAAQFYTKLNRKKAIENGNEVEDDDDDEHEIETEEEEEELEEMEVDAEAMEEMEMELEVPSCDTCSSSSTSTSTSNSSSLSSTTSTATSSSGGDQLGQGHGPGIGFDQLKLDQTQVQVHCADDPAPGESGDCLCQVKEHQSIESQEEKLLEQPLLTEVPSPLEYQNQYFPMPSLKAIKLASKSKLNAQAAVYKMPSSSSPSPLPSASDLDNSVVLSPATAPFRLNVKAPVFKPTKEGLDQLVSGTYQLLMRQMNLLHQAPDPLAHIHPLRSYPRHRTHAHLLPNPQAQSMPHSRDQQMPHPKDQLMKHSKDQMMPHPNDQLMPHPKDQLRTHPKVQQMPHSKDHKMPHPKDREMQHPKDQLMPHPKSQLMPHSKSQLITHPRSQLISHPRSQLISHPRSQLMPHSQTQQMPHRRTHLLPTPPPHVRLQPPYTHHHHNRQGAAYKSLLGLPPQLPEQLMHRIASKQELRCRKEPLPDLFPEVLTLMGELVRPISYPEIVTILAARLRRPVVELKRHIPHTLHAAVIHGYLSKEGNRYSLLSESEHMAIKRRNYEAAQRAKELEKEPLSWRKR